MYVDKDGEFFWIIPSISWSKQGGFSFGLSLVFGIPGGLSLQIGAGYNFKSNEPYVYGGATFMFNTAYISYSPSSQWNVGYTFGASPFSGLPVSTNFFTIGANYNITYGKSSFNLSAWEYNNKRWSFNPSVSVTLFPERTSNFFKGKGFKNNDQVLNQFIADGEYQKALDYFGIKGKYDPNNRLFKNISAYAVTDPVTGEIFYSDNAFTGGYDRLAFIADHERIHSDNVLSGMYDGVKIDDVMRAREEWGTYMQNYKRQGLYPNHGMDIIESINYYGIPAMIYSSYVTPTGIYSNQFNARWWHYMYQIPRTY
jgi:hypothetical protein